MSTLRTVYRASVMIATGIIAYKGWQLYGPTTEQMKSGVAQAMELAQQAVASPKPAETAGATAIDPRVAGGSATLAGGGGAIAAERLEMSSAPTLTPEGSLRADATEPPQLLPDDRPDAEAKPSDRLAEAMSQLESLGIADKKLTTWGSSGRLHRFCCRAEWGNSPGFSRHFESVASAPEEAVERVLADVVAWRGTQQDRAALRQ